RRQPRAAAARSRLDPARPAPLPAAAAAEILKQSVCGRRDVCQPSGLDRRPPIGGAGCGAASGPHSHAIDERGRRPESGIMQRTLIEIGSAAAGAGKTKSPPDRGAEQWRVLRSLAPYVWPSDRPDLQATVIVSLLLMLLAKIVTVSMPFAFKWAT